MPDFPFTESNEWTSFYLLSVYSVFYFAFNKYLVICKYSNVKQNVPVKKIIFLIGFFLVTHCMHGDFFFMMERVQRDFCFIKDAYNVGEPIYVDIAKFVNRNYFLFRVIVWGGAFYLFLQTAKRLKIQLTIAVLVLFIIYSVTFAYARATLAMAIYFYGLSYLCISYKNIIVSYILGVFIILLATPFHSSAFVMIAMTLVVFIPLKKWIYILSIFSIPVLALLLRTVFASLLLIDSVDEVVLGKMSRYAEGEEARGIAAFTINALNYAIIYIPYLLILSKIVKKNQLPNLSKDIVFYFKVDTGLILLATIFFFAGDNFYTFFYRILFMAMIPTALLIAKLYQFSIITNRELRLFLLIGIGYHLAQYAYSLYLAIIK